MMDIAEYYPEWLGQDLINDNFDWHDALKTTMPAFLKEYSLHDSYWICLLAHPNHELIGVIRFDSYWSNNRIPYPGSSVIDWPVLLIRFKHAYDIFLNGLEDGETIANAKSDLIDSSIREHLFGNDFASGGRREYFKTCLLDDSLHQTVIEDIYGGSVDIWHSASVEILCLSNEKKSLPIPDVA